jgi:mannitol-1-phosphate 5-dehydrogenase
MNRPGKTIVIVGAGRIGRGFVGDLFAAAGYHLVLVDCVRALVERLRQAGRYRVVRFQGGDLCVEAEVGNYTALHTSQEAELVEAIVRADLVAVAVYPQDFVDVVQELAPGLVARLERRPDAPLDLLLCTNLLHPGERFRASFAQALPSQVCVDVASSVGIVETVVIRIATDPPFAEREQDSLQVWTNGYPDLLVERHAFKGPLPPVPGLVPVEDIEAQEVRKLYTYNTFHASLAYLGALKGYESVAECLADPQVRTAAVGALQEAARAVQAEYGFTAAEMARWNADLVRRTDIPALRDTVRRFGADPRRKLRPGDRLIGPAVLAQRHGIETPYLARAAAAAFSFQVPGDVSAQGVRELVAALGIEGAVRKLCALGDREAGLIREIVRAYERQERES